MYRPEQNRTGIHAARCSVCNYASGNAVGRCGKFMAKYSYKSFYSPLVERKRYADEPQKCIQSVYALLKVTQFARRKLCKTFSRVLYELRNRNARIRHAQQLINRYRQLLTLLTRTGFLLLLVSAFMRLYKLNWNDINLPDV